MKPNKIKLTKKQSNKIKINKQLINSKSLFKEFLTYLLNM